MKSVQFKSKSNDKLNHLRKSKLAKNDKTGIPTCVKATENNNQDIIRQGSSPDSSWVPSRDWHRYLSGEQSDKLSVLRAEADWQEHIGSPPQLPLSKPGDEFVNVKLPDVNFCSGERSNLHEPGLITINQLCDEDKAKIAQLIEQLARYKQEKEEDEDTILKLKSKIMELKTSLKLLMVEKNTENKTISNIKTLHTNEQTALKKQLSELNQLLCEMQIQKSTSEAQMKTITAQAERMTRAIHALHKENTELQIELRVNKERLLVAQQAVDKMTNDLKGVQEKIKPLTEDKACQSNEHIGNEKVFVKKIGLSTPENTSTDQKILSELFFNKALQNDFSPRETIIFLPGDH